MFQVKKYNIFPQSLEMHAHDNQIILWFLFSVINVLLIERIVVFFICFVKKSIKK